MVPPQSLPPVFSKPWHSDLGRAEAGEARGLASGLPDQAGKSHTAHPLPPVANGAESLCIIIESGRMSESHVHLFLKLVTSEKQDEASFGHCCVSSPWLCVQSGTGRQGLSSGDMREDKVVPGQRDGMGWAWKQGWPSEEQNLEVQGS